MFYLIKNSSISTSLVKNVFSLGFLQIANYIFPLITAPYLVRTLGADNYGLIAFSTATLAYLALVVDYGFNWTGVRQISINRHNQLKVNKLFSTIMLIKFIILILSFVFLNILIFSFDKFGDNKELFYTTFIFVAANAFIPVWLFQGLEKMSYVTYQSVFTKGFFTFCIFIFVNKQDDYLFVPLLLGIGAFISAVLSLLFIYKTLNVRLIVPSFEEINEQIVDGWHVFYTNLAISLYTVSSTFILGLFASPAVVGYYAAAEKVIQAAKGLNMPLSHSLFPYVSKMFDKDKLRGLKVVKIALLISTSYNLLISTLIFFLAPVIVSILFGEEFETVITLLKIMAFLPLIVGLSNIFGVQIMLNINLKKQMSLIITLSAITGIILSFCFVPIYEEMATSIIIVFVETLVTFLMFLYLYITGHLTKP